MSNDVNSKMITRAEFLEFKNDVNRRFDQVDKNQTEFKADVKQGFTELRQEMSTLRNWMVGTSLSVVMVALAAIGTFGTLMFQVFDKLQ